MKKTMKRWIAALLSLVLILGGASYFANEKMDTVEAEEAVEESVDYGTYVWKSVEYANSDTAPTCDEEGYFFAGYYEDDQTTPVAEPEQGTQYQAKFVPANVLSVKCQTEETVNSTSGPAKVRVITTVDSLNYQEVGFRLKTAKKEQTFKITGVMTKITANFGVGDYSYSPVIFDLASKYYAAATFTNVADHTAEFFVEPYWKTLDGTKVTGISRHMSIADSYAAQEDNQNDSRNLGYVNIPVYLDDTVNIGAGATITINQKYYTDSSSTPTGEMMQYRYRSHIIGEVGERLGLSADDIKVERTGTVYTITIPEGATETTAKGLLLTLKFQMRYYYLETQTRDLYEMTGTYGANDIKVCDIAHRNFKVEAKKPAGADNIDRSLFVSGSPDKVVITTIPELRGFLKSLETDNLTNKTVILATDLDLNPSMTAKGENPTATVTHSPSKSFSGTFDGLGNSIKGLYVNDATNGGGLFAELNAAGTVKNLVLDNCYVSQKNGDNSKNNAGVLAGTVLGTVENVEVKNSTVSSGGNAGALCGMFKGTANDIAVTGCAISSTFSTATYFAGGVVGYAEAGNYLIDGATVTDCKISNTAGGAAGVAGYLKSKVSNIQLENTDITGGAVGAAGVTVVCMGTVENVKIIGGTITGTYRLGGIAGQLNDNAAISGAYCDATITSSSSDAAGGIAAFANQKGNIKIKECWFAGKLTGKDKLGGIVGEISASGVEISHCYNTGEIDLTVSAKQAGGIVGVINATAAGKNVSITDSMNFSKFLHKLENAVFVGSVFGVASGQNANVTISKTYGINGIYDVDGEGPYSSGWSGTGYCQATASNITIDGNQIAAGEIIKTNFVSENQLKSLLDLDSNWWNFENDVPRLKTFADMEFKRPYAEQPAQ